MTTNSGQSALGDLNKSLGTLNGFSIQSISAKDEISFSFFNQHLENTAFGHLTEVPINILYFFYITYNVYVRVFNFLKYVFRRKN